MYQPTRSPLRALLTPVLTLLLGAPLTLAQVTLQILHSSDFEAAVPALTDAPDFAAVLDALDDTHATTLILSSGDNFLPGPFMSAGEDPSLQQQLRNAYIAYYGGPFANNDLRAAIGRVDITIMNLLGVEAAALGNHEFDLGTSELRNMIAGVPSGSNIRWFGAQFPYLSCNLSFAADGNLSNISTSSLLPHTAFRSNPAQTAAQIAATPKIAPYTTITKNGVTYGLVGVTTPVLAQISSPGTTTVQNPGGGTNNMALLATLVQPAVDILRAQGIEKIILLSHLQQLEFEKQLAPLLNGVDIIIAGGSHTLMANPQNRLRAGDTAAEAYPFLTMGADGHPIAILNTTSEYRYVGRLVIDFDANDRIVPSSIDPAVSGAWAADEEGVEDLYGGVYANGFAPGSKGQQVKSLCDAIAAVIVAKDGNINGRTSVFLEGRRNSVRTEETNLGNLTADANKWMAQFHDPAVNISFKNGGGIRSAIGSVNAVGGNVTLEPPAANPIAGKQQGDISQLDIENSLRFNNLLSVLTLDAAGLRTILEHGVAASTATATPGQFPQVSGVHFSYDITLPASGRVRNAVIVDDMENTLDTLVMNGLLYGDPARTFRVVTLNFLASGGDGYPFNTLGTNRVDLNTLPPAGPGLASFALHGSEQDAFAEYMKSLFSATPFATADTPIGQDDRIQRINARPDCILPPVFFADEDGDGFGDPSASITLCPGIPEGYVSNSDDDCPSLFGRIGDPCDDGDHFTTGDAVTSNCECAGITFTCELRTVQQGEWGARPRGSNRGAYLHANFSEVFGQGLEIGCTNKLRLTNAGAITNFLPSGGTPQQLPVGTLTNPTNYNNTLAGQLVTAKLNVVFDEQDADFAPSIFQLGNAYLSSGLFMGMTVNEVIILADQLIGGCASIYTPSQLNNALSAINSSYSGNTPSGFLTCIPPVSQRSLSVATPALEELSAYPNPAGEQITVRARFAKAGPVTLELLDMTGRTVANMMTYRAEEGDLRLEVIDLKGLESGTYLLNVTHAGTMNTLRIVVAH